MSCRIAPLPSGAAAPLAQLHRRCFPDDPWDAEACSAILGMPRCFGLLAWEDAMPVGLGLGLDLGGECEILSLGVVPERRRRGIGAALLAAIGAVARRRGAQSLVLEVAEDNRAAKVLYAAHGFVMIGRRVHYYRRGRHSIAALVLRCPLISPPDST